jgi:mono/diheme cytochrome c family protein
MTVAAEPASRYPDAAADALARQIALGDYYEALGISPSASGRDIAAALMGRRRQFPTLDQEWNTMQTALAQQRARYDAARAMRDEIMDELLRTHDDAVCKRMTRQAIWQQLWLSNTDEAPLALRRAQVLLQAQAWQGAERSLAQAREVLSAEFGQGIWQLLDAATNWQEVHRNLPALPQALEAFALQLPTSGREVATQLPEIEITAQEAAQQQARRLQVHRQDCPTCHGSRQVQSNLQEALQERASSAGSALQSLSELAERYQRGLGSTLDLRASVPCPACTQNVTFRVPPGARHGWVLCGKDQAGGQHFARLGELKAAPASATAPARAVTPDHAPARRPSISSVEELDARRERFKRVLLWLYLAIVALVLVVAFASPQRSPGLLGLPLRGVDWYIILAGGALVYLLSRNDR